jgi:hypothetical protein
MFVEFGCGKAEFSGYIHKAIGDPARFILIDRSRSRLKVQRANPNTPSGTWKRLQVDIKDLHLGNLMQGGMGKEIEQVESIGGMVAVSKHL